VEPSEKRFSFERTAELLMYSTASLKKRKREGLLEASRDSIPVDQSRGISPQVGKEHGLGMAKTAQLKAALEIGRRLSLTQLDEKYQIKSPADAANLVIAEFTHLDRDERPIWTREPEAESWLESFAVLGGLIPRGNGRSVV
jgi:hypothetical protein